MQAKITHVKLFITHRRCCLYYPLHLDKTWHNRLFCVLCEETFKVERQIETNNSNCRQA